MGCNDTWQPPSPISGHHACTRGLLLALLVASFASVLILLGKSQGTQQFPDTHRHTSYLPICQEQQDVVFPSALLHDAHCLQEVQGLQFESPHA
jgi:hypothetical protein